MEPAPIRDGAIRPQGRPPRALPAVPVRLVVRLVALAGLAFAGWVAFSALNGTAAHAARHDTPNQDAVIAATRPVDPVRQVSAAERVADQAIGDRPVQRLSHRVGDIGEQPLRYLRERRHDVMDGKDRVVRRLEELTGAAGIPLVRIPDVRHTPVAGVARGDVAHPSSVANRPLPQQREQSAQGPGEAAPGGGARARAELGAAPSGMVAGDADDRHTGDCAGCHSEQRDPALPPGQDEPGGGSGGGHQLSPVADLMTGGRYPAVPAALDPNTFHRTALTDVSAPGGPSVVPD